jgi:signal transduction histidine kinase
MMGRDRRQATLDRLRRTDHSAFRRARLHLTAWYVLTLAVIVIVFSLALYGALAAQLSQHQGDGGDTTPERQVEHDTSDFALSRLRLLLLAGNAIFLLGATGGAYLLAGKTLGPIAAALERQRRFTADASHELRTPLTVMQGTIDVALQRERSPAAYRDVLRELGEETTSMTALVEQLLRLARGRPRPAMVACDLAATLAEVVRSTQDLAADRGSAVSSAALGPLVVRGDPLALRQALLNLVLNAIQHTPPGSQIRITGQQDEHGVEVKVADNGPGVAAAEREQIFQPFHRAATAASDGAGLGLALAREAVLAHDGTITVEETPGGGATFRVRLPWNCSA